MNVEPTFQRTILDLERKRFGVKNIYDVEEKPKQRISNYGQGPIKKAKRKSAKQDEYFHPAESHNTFSRISMDDRYERDSNRSSNRSFDRYKSNL